MSMYELVPNPGCCPDVTGVLLVPVGNELVGVVATVPPSQSENGAPPGSGWLLAAVLRKPVRGSY
jgi:hypothetical protein